MASKSRRIGQIAAELRRRAVALAETDPFHKTQQKNGPEPVVSRPRHEVAMTDAIGWRFIFSLEVDHTGYAKAIFSAQLIPPGRSSSEDDWKTVGMMAAALGAPLDAILTPLAEADPNLSHYWIWYPHDPAHALNDFAREGHRKALGVTRSLLTQAHQNRGSES